jgi:hypothetical protein
MTATVIIVDALLSMQLRAAKLAECDKMKKQAAKPVWEMFL